MRYQSYEGLERRTVRAAMDLYARDTDPAVVVDAKRVFDGMMLRAFNGEEAARFLRAEILFRKLDEESR